MSKSEEENNPSVSQNQASLAEVWGEGESKVPLLCDVNQLSPQATQFLFSHRLVYGFSRGLEVFDVIVKS